MQAGRSPSPRCDHLCGPELHGELDGAGDPLRGRRDRGLRTGSSSLSVKRCSSSTFSRSQARCHSSARAARAETGGSHDSFVSLFDRCEDRSTRFHRVTSVMHHNLGSTPHASSTARNSQFAHSRATGLHGWVSLNSVSSVGNTEDGRRRFWRKKASSSSTRCWVRRSAVDELAHAQQASRKMHDETWAGLLREQGLKISREVEIIPGCAVQVSCPSCPDNSPVSPGSGRVMRNMLGWSKLEKTDRSGVWLFHGCPERRDSFFFPLRSTSLRNEGIVLHSMVGPLFVCLVARPRYRATY